MTMEITLGAAILAGIISFLSPCVLPVVPAYLGQLGVVVAHAPVPFAAAGGASLATAGGPATATLPTLPARPGWGASGGWRSLPNALAFVVGFGTIFTLFGLLLNAAVNPFRQYDDAIRIISGSVLILLGLNLMGVLRPSTLMRTWRPLDRFRGDGFGAQRTPRRGVVGGLILGATFGVGWSPCIGPTLGAILSMSMNQGPGIEVALLLIAYSLGLGLPFVALALAVDKAPAITRPLVKHGRTIELVGGALVVTMGVAILFDWLTVIYQAFSAFIPQV